MNGGLPTFHSIVLVTALFLAWIAHPAFAQDGLYLEFTPGVSILADSDLSGASGGVVGFSGTAKFDTGFVIGGAVGSRFGESFRGELNLSYRQADLDTVTSGGVTLPGSGDLWVLALMSNVYYDFDLGVPITPYVGAGIGLGFINDDATEFAWNVMLGASYSVTDHIDLSLGYRYLETTDAELDFNFAGLSGTVKTEITVHEILFGFRYNFQKRTAREPPEVFPKPIPIQNVEESQDEPDLVEQLAELHRMHQAGELTDEEYKRAKARLLN